MAKTFQKGVENEMFCGGQDTWEWAPVELLQNAIRPSPRDFAAMVDLPEGKLLLFGGLDASEKRLDDTWIFDTITWVHSSVSTTSLTACTAGMLS